tara:strand:+ start:11802 stop:12065 length:264 start_codon:yes stop_codon:yes gene_type:complete
MNLGVTYFGSSRDGRDSVTIVTLDGQKGMLLKTQRDSFGTESGIKDALRAKFSIEQRDQIHVHKNRDGSFAFAIGREPKVWSEDEKE